MSVLFDGFAPVTLCNLYLHGAIKSPFLLYGKYDRGYRDVQRVTVLEYVCEVSLWGRVSAPAGVAPEALEECLYSSKGYKRRPAGLLHWG